MKSKLFKKSHVKMFSYLFIAGVLILSSCTSGKKAMERGNYYESVMLSVSRLQKNPTHKKSIETLRSAYPLSLQYYDDNIRNLKARDDRNKWRGIVDSYTNVNNMYEAIRRSPGALNVVNNPKNYYNELAQAKENAAEESYQFGITELNKQTVESGRIAYGAFKDTDSYVPGFKDVIAKMEEAYWMGTIKVLINPIPVTTSRVQLSANFFEDKIHEYLKTQPINEFTRFMTDADLQAMNLAPDQILQMQFDDFTIGQVSTVERQIDQTMDSVVVGSVNASSLVGGNTGTIRPTNTSVNNNTNVSNTNVNNTTNTNNTNTTNNTSNTNVNTSNTNNTTTSNTSVNTTNTNNTNTSNSTNVNNTTNTAVNTSSNTNVSNTTTNTGNTGSNTNTTTNSTNNNTNNTTTGTVSTANTGTTGTNTNTTNSTNSTKAGKYTVSVCHAANNANQIININENALSAHLGHGDKLYDCNSNSNTKVRICHNAGSNKTQTIEVSTSALKAHLDHGDVLGGCDGTGYKVEAAKSNSSEDKKENPKKGNGNSENGNDESYLLASSEVSSAMYASLFGYNEIKADTNINVYSTVKAKVFIFEKTVKSFGTLDMKILDAKTGSLISAEKFTGEYIWKSQWGYFNGDERALTDEQKTIVGQREAQPPNDQDMFILFTQPIFDQLMNKMKRFYN